MARLTLSFLGPFQANIDSLPVKGFESDKVRALLAYLVVESARPHLRTSLASLLWPDQPQDAALKNLRHTLYKLRQTLDEENREAGNTSQDYLLITLQSVQFNTASDFSLDVSGFAGAYAACTLHRHRRLEVCGTCHTRLMSAVELYKDDFLSGFSLEGSATFDEWLLLKREEFHHQALLTLTLLAQYYEARGDHATAINYAWRQLKLEPWREEAHRQLMRLRWMMGQRSAALTQYESCRRILAEEFDIAPDSETQALYDRILSGAYEGPESASGRANTLPNQLTPFIGRKAELDLIAERLEDPDHRLLTLVGPGGIGKTRLALESAAAHAPAFDGGVYFVPFAAVTSPQLLAPTIVDVLKLYDTTLVTGATETPEVQLLNYLADKEILLVLDNFEHLLAGVDLLASILKRAPRVTLLITSRAHLGLPTEAIISISGLTFPGESFQSADASDIKQYEAIQLFVERAASADEQFTLSPKNIGGVATICRLVAGQPLGLELASVLVRDYSPDEIAAAIKRNMDFLETNLRDIPPQHRSLRAVFGYSWDLLTPEEQYTFQRLSVFRGGWDVEAAHEVDPTLSVEGAPDVLASLVSKSLLRHDETGRYDIHEILRQYAAEKLDAVPAERTEAIKSHARYYLKLFTLVDIQLKKRQDVGTWLARSELEHNNLRAALSWAIENENIELALKLGEGGLRFWYLHSHYSEGRANLSSLLNMAEAKGVDEEGSGTTYSEEVQKSYGQVLYGMGVLARTQGHHDVAQASLQKSLAIYKRVKDVASISSVMNVLGIVAHDQGDYITARAYYEECLQLARDSGNRITEAIYLNNMAALFREQGDYTNAGIMVSRSLVISRELNDINNISLGLLGLGLLDWYRGEYVSAQANLKESLGIFCNAGGKMGMADCLEGLARVAASQGQIERSALLWGSAEYLREQMGSPVHPADREDYERNIAAARSQIDEQRFNAEWAAGRKMGTDEAVAFALQ